MFALLLILFSLPVALAFWLRSQFGVKKLEAVSEESLDWTAGQLAESLFEHSGRAEAKVMVGKRAKWDGLRAEAGTVYLTEKIAESKQIVDLAAAAQRVGLALLAEKNAASVRWRQRLSLQSRLVFSLGCVCVIFSMLSLKIQLLYGLLILLAVMAVFAILRLTSQSVERDAAELVAVLLKKKRFMRRLAEEDRLLEMMRAEAWRQL
ncbi:zinc metallopeptidase [Persicirhabdus sediminis]|uniref:Zinc metallopeptidase n=1 Tax=Persicirhabdus sediminis TaxID=454144 RepID=A0A8J7MDS1_9BACT|nr:zinc metallopeptidase [Persicirhabdus sediminis]MBK1790663.1 zinc metallopeptidase [Persicirhabdus sediminis]